MTKLRRNVEQIKDDIETIKQDFNSMKNSIDIIKNKVDSLTTGNLEINSKLNYIIQQLNNKTSAKSEKDIN